MSTVELKEPISQAADVQHQESLVDFTEVTSWTSKQKFVFRTTFVYILLLTVPLTARFYQSIYKIDWANFYWSNLSSIASGFGSPEFITIAKDDAWGLFSYINLWITLLVSVTVAALWTAIVRARKTERKEYHTLYYWILVIARYRLAFGVIAWGYKKLIPIQMELPTVGFLNTTLGDFREQKLYWQSVGIVQHYEMFLGFAEVLAGLLLLFRKTTALGAALTVVLMLNIAVANHAYDGGVHVHSFTYALLGFLILWKYLPNIWNLLILEKDVIPLHIYPFFKGKNQILRAAVKSSSIGVFVLFLFYLHWIDDRGYRFGINPGLENSIGHYNVTEFRLNNKVIPYSPLDSVRWQYAAFERWSTITYKVNRKQWMDLDNNKGERNDLDMRFELSGIGDGRHFFYYEEDKNKQEITLQNKNPKHRDQKQTLHYSRPSDSRIVLTGINEFNDSIDVVLDKSNKNYPLNEGRQQGSVY